MKNTFLLLLIICTAGCRTVKTNTSISHIDSVSHIHTDSNAVHQHIINHMSDEDLQVVDVLELNFDTTKPNSIIVDSAGNIHVVGISNVRVKSNKNYKRKDSLDEHVFDSTMKSHDDQTVVTSFIKMKNKESKSYQGWYIVFFVMIILIILSWVVYKLRR